MHRRVTPELFLHSDVTLLFFSGLYSTIFCRHPQIIRGLPMLSNHFFFLPVIIPLLLEYPLYNKTECSGIRECNLIMYHFLTAGFRNERPEGRLPLIGLSPGQTDDGSLSLRRFYMDAVKKAGGLPVLLPFLSDASEAVPFADRLDGLLLTGGPDPHPSLFGEETRTGCGFVSPVRLFQGSEACIRYLPRRADNQCLFWRNTVAGSSLRSSLRLSRKPYLPQSALFARPSRPQDFHPSWKPSAPDRRKGDAFRKQLSSPGRPRSRVLPDYLRPRL